jgi:ABC-type transport system involved in multi-copper enzyme maturation permease subunit
MTKALPTILIIAKHTIADEIQQRSLVIMFAICAIFVFSARGCFKGTYMVNGQLLDAETITLKVSQIIFNIITVGSMFITALLSMRVFRRDRENGVQSCILSKPIDRRNYVAGKVLGVWSLAMIFMFILHSIVFLIASISLRTLISEYLIASLLCSLNLLFVVLSVLLLTLLLPDVVSFLCIVGISIVSWISEGIYALSNSQIFQSMVNRPGVQQHSDFTLGKVIYYVWPKLSGLQHWASSMIGNNTAHGYASLYPFINVLVYCLIIGVLLLQNFRNEDIA